SSGCCRAGGLGCCALAGAAAWAGYLLRSASCNALWARGDIPLGLDCGLQAGAFASGSPPLADPSGHRAEHCLGFDGGGLQRPKSSTRLCDRGGRECDLVAMVALDRSAGSGGARSCSTKWGTLSPPEELACGNGRNNRGQFSRCVFDVAG